MSKRDRETWERHIASLTGMLGWDETRPEGNWKFGWKVVRYDDEGRMFSCTLTAEWVEYRISQPTCRPDVYVPPTELEARFHIGGGEKKCGPLTVFTNFQNALRFSLELNFYFDGPGDELLRAGIFEGTLADKMQQHTMLVPCVYKESYENYIWCWRNLGKPTWIPHVFTSTPPSTAFADVVVVLPNSTIDPATIRPVLPKW
jgi:hypothetical protein